MHLWSRMTGLSRFAFAVRGVLAETVSVDDSVRAIETGVRLRRERFLQMLERAVYPNPRSPYRALLAAAGCGPGDVERLVSAEGLDEALAVLARAGVRVSYEEFKCRMPIVRGSRTLHVRPDDFDDPVWPGQVWGTTGGTRGPALRVPIDASHIASLAPYWAVFLAENDCLGAPLIFWTPGHSGVAARYLACARAGQRYAHWFVSEKMSSLRSRIYAGSVHWLARRAGRFPRSESAPFSEPDRVLDRLLGLLDDARRAAVQTTPSAAAKLSLAAQERGRALTGLTFLLGAEPLTPARRATIEASGASAASLYGSSEAPWIGGQCKGARSSDEVHVLEDSYAVVPAPEPPREETGGTKLLLTSLRSAAPKVLLNVDIGDRAVRERAPCDCLYDRLGCRLRLHTIRSSDKITELGVTFAVQDVFHVLEEIFPRRFGGAAGDYQLVETGDGQGLPRYTILVNPRLTVVDEGRLPAAFLAELGKLQPYYGFMTSAWAREELITVRRAQPYATAAGKVLPFHRTGDSPIVRGTRR